MTNHRNKYVYSCVLAIAVFLFAFLVQPTSAQSVPPLGAAQSFAALAGTAITATGPAVISGNVGVSPGSAVTGFPPAIVQNGQIYTGAASLAGSAQSSALIAYNDLKGQTCNSANNLTGKILGQTPGFLTLVPGVYCFDTSAQLNQILTLNDGGDPNAIFIFQIGTTLTTASSSQVLMSSGGRGTNVYWQVGTSATIGTSTTFRGHIIADTSITLTTSATTTGRVFALNGAATIDSTAVDALPTGGIEFSVSNFNMNEGCGETTITVKRSDSNGIATVEYSTSDNTALQRTDYTLGTGTVTFADGEATRTFILLATKDAYNAEGMQSVNLSLSNPTGATVGSQGTATLSIIDDTSVPTNSQPIDDTGTFVCQHYHDFLNRQSDSNGQAFWANQIISCGNDATCIDEKRNNVSAAFFLSIEFQNTGYFAFRFYRASFLDSAQRPRGVPRFIELHRDGQKLQQNVVVGQPNWEAFLEQNKLVFALDWVARAEFITEYPTTMTRDDFINKLFLRSGVTPTAQELNLANNPEFVAPGPDASTRLKAAAGRVQGGLKVTAPEEGNLIKFSYDSSNPQMAAMVANGIADSFINATLQRRYEASAYARKFLERQIAKTRGDLERSERALVGYAQAQGIINTGKSADGRAEGYARLQRRQALLAAEKRSQPAMTIMLEALSRALPDGAWLDRLEVSQGSVTFAGKAANAAGLIGPIEASQHFTDVQFSAPTTRAEGTAQESFTITAKIVTGKELD